MKKIKCRIEGVSPLLMHAFTDAAALAIQGGHRKVNGGQADLPREVAKGYAYATPEGMLYIPGPNLFAAMISAGKFHKLGRNKVSTNSSSLVPAGISIDEPTLALGTKEFEVDSRRIVNPTTRGAQICHRPILHKWGVDLTLTVDETLFPLQLVRKILDDAGQKIGVCAFRPERRGPFGRFVVTHWEEET